nr:hypothetical protein GCM10020093_080990 [Planobispora longispora]
MEHVPARQAGQARWPDWVAEPLVTRWANQGISGLWPHQAEAAELAHGGRNVIIATGTASGKSLAYQVPAITSVLDGGTVLYLTPTKALAADQLRVLNGLDLPGLRAATFDGDTSYDERDWVRRHANYILTNPDMLHRSLLPRHPRWSAFWRRLSMVVIDECHGYRGVFGSHVAQILRRLRRICARYGSRPVFFLSSATASEPRAFATRLTGLQMAEVTTDASPGCDHLRPLGAAPDRATGRERAPVRRPATAETADLLADLVLADVRTLAFVRSRRAAESVSLTTRARLSDLAADAGLPADLPEKVSAYRAGYLAEDRRKLEKALRSGECLGLATTSALELGVDVSGLDAVLIAGWPGTRASLWQQAGRAAGPGRTPWRC